MFKGAGTAIATPFDENGVNIKEFKRLIEFQISEGIDAIIVCGTTGESSTMTKEEKISAIKCAVETSNGRVPIIAGTGSNNTAQAIEMSKVAEGLGVDGLLLVTPYYNKTTQKGLIAHYTAIAKEVSLPIILYSVPSRTGVNIAPETCLELSKIEGKCKIYEKEDLWKSCYWWESICKEHEHRKKYYCKADNKMYCLVCFYRSHLKCNKKEISNELEEIDKYLDETVKESESKEFAEEIGAIDKRTSAMEGTKIQF